MGIFFFSNFPLISEDGMIDAIVIVISGDTEERLRRFMKVYNVPLVDNASSKLTSIRINTPSIWIGISGEYRRQGEENIDSIHMYISL